MFVMRDPYIPNNPFTNLPLTTSELVQIFGPRTRSRPGLRQITQQNGVSRVEAYDEWKQSERGRQFIQQIEEENEEAQNSQRSDAESDVDDVEFVDNAMRPSLLLCVWTQELYPLGYIRYETRVWFRGVNSDYDPNITSSPHLRALDDANVNALHTALMNEDFSDFFVDWASNVQVRRHSSAHETDYVVSFRYTLDEAGENIGIQMWVERMITVLESAAWFPPSDWVVTDNPIIVNGHEVGIAYANPSEQINWDHYAGGESEVVNTILIQTTEIFD
jgi:hypothetical protein